MARYFLTFSVIWGLLSLLYAPLIHFALCIGYLVVGLVAAIIELDQPPTRLKPYKTRVSRYKHRRRVENHK